MFTHRHNVPASQNSGRRTLDSSQSLHFYAIFPILQQSPRIEHIITARDSVYNLGTMPLKRNMISNGGMWGKTGRCKYSNGG